jgi:hypothetical protein
MTSLFSLSNRQISSYTPNAYPGSRPGTRDSNLAPHQRLTMHVVYPSNPGTNPCQPGRTLASSTTGRTTTVHPIFQ